MDQLLRLFCSSGGEIGAGLENGSRERALDRTGGSPPSDNTIIPAADDAAAAVTPGATRESSRSEENAAATRKSENEDELLTYLAVAIAMAIAGILVRNFLRQVMV